MIEYEIVDYLIENKYLQSALDSAFTVNDFLMDVSATKTHYTFEVI